MHRFALLFGLIFASSLFAQTVPARIRVAAEDQERKLIEKVEPVYPAPARARRITGVVICAVVVGTDGSIVEAKLVSGHPLLVPAAAVALRKFVYEPTMVGGRPVEVITQVRFRFEARIEGAEGASCPHADASRFSRVPMGGKTAIGALLLVAAPFGANRGYGRQGADGSVKTAIGALLLVAALFGANRGLLQVA